MKTKKLLGMFLALTMIFSMVIIPQAVTVNADYASDYVLFDYNFDEYTGGKVFGSNSANGTNVSLVGLSQSQVNKLFLGEEGGNKYLYSDVDAWLKANPSKALSDWANAGFYVVFNSDFPAEGAYAVSFDLRMDEDAKDSTRNFTIRHDDKSFYSFAGNATSGKFYGYKGTSTLDTKGEEGTPYEFTPGTTYHVDFVYDLDNDTFKSYVDGTLLANRVYSGVLAGQKIRFNMEQEVGFFDNLKVAKIASGSFQANMTYADNKATISFTESILAGDAALSAADFVVTNEATGEAVAVESVTKTAYNEVELTFAEGTFKNGFTYTITPIVTNVAGNAVANAAELTISLPADEKTAYVEEFADFETGDIAVDDLEKRNYNDFYLMCNQAQIDKGSVRHKAPQAIDAGNDGKSIRVIRSAYINDGGDFTVKLPHKIYLEGEVTLEYRMRAGETLDVFRAYLIGKDEMGYQLSAGNSIPSIYYEANSARYVKNTASYSGTAQIINSEVDADRANADYHVYKAVYNFDAETVDFYFDGEKFNSTPQPIANFKNANSGTIKKGYFNYVDMRINNDEDDYADIDYIKVTQRVAAPYVNGEITYKDYNGNAATAATAGIKEIAIPFGGNISEASLTADSVQLLDGETPVAYNGKFDATACTYTMTIPGLLAGGKTYTLKVTDAVTDPYNVPIVAEKEVAITTGAGAREAMVSFTEGKEAATLANLADGDQVKLTLTLIDTNAVKKPVALIGTVTNGGYLSDAVRADATWQGCVGTATLTLDAASIANIAVTGFVFDATTLVAVTQAPFVLE